MTGLGIIPTIAALKNYKNAKAEYNNVLARYNEFQSIAEALFDDWTQNINDYNEAKDGEYLRHLDFGIQEDNKPEGVDAVVLLRVANLVGKLFYAQPVVVLSNSSKKRYSIHAIDADMAVYGSGIQLFKIEANMSDLVGAKKIQNRIEPNLVLNSGATMYFALPFGITGIGEESIKKLRDYICQVCGKKLITSCPKVNVIGASGKERELIDTSILVEWRLYENKKGEVGDLQTGVWVDKPGIIGYRGEAGLSDLSTDDANNTFLDPTKY